MAKQETPESSKNNKPRRIRKVETVRERSTQDAAKANKAKPAKKLKSSIGSGLSRVASAGRKEIYIPMPDNRFGKFLNKRRSFIPKYFVESWREVKKVTWPDRKQTWQLTFAVFVFAFVFGALITIVDYGLDKVFKAVLLQ